MEKVLFEAPMTAMLRGRNKVSSIIFSLTVAKINLNPMLHNCGVRIDEALLKIQETPGQRADV
jgi:hypothetical protein